MVMMMSILYSYGCMLWCIFPTNYRKQHKASKVCA